MDRGSFGRTIGNPPGWEGSVIDGVPKTGRAFNGTYGWYVTRARFPIEGMTERNLVDFVKKAHRRLIVIARAENLFKLLNGKPVSREDTVGLVTNRLSKTYLADFTHRRFSIKVDSRGFVEFQAVSLVGDQREQAERLLNTLAMETELLVARRGR
jgi:hypothetical protein